MTSEPLPTPGDWVSSVDTGRVACYFDLDPGGWILALSFASFRGSVQLVGAAVLYAGDTDPLGAAQALTESPLPAVPPENGFRYRWLRDLGQQFERGARDQLRSNEALLAFLAGSDWFETDAPTKGYGIRFYAEQARRFVDAGGSYDALDASYETARDWIKKARKLGLLNAPGKGRRGHTDLTDYGRQVLSDGER